VAQILRFSRGQSLFGARRNILPNQGLVELLELTLNTSLTPPVVYTGRYHALATRLPCLTRRPHISYTLAERAPPTGTLCKAQFLCRRVLSCSTHGDTTETFMWKRHPKHPPLLFTAQERTVVGGRYRNLSYHRRGCDGSRLLSRTSTHGETFYATRNPSPRSWAAIRRSHAKQWREIVTRYLRPHWLAVTTRTKAYRVFRSPARNK